MSDAATLRAALQCDRPNCPCQRDRGPTHCPSHDDAHPSFDIDERDGRLLVHCHAGCTQEQVIDALRARRLWTGTPPAPKVKGPLFDVCRFIERYLAMPSDHATHAVAAWIALTHVQEAFDIAPYLAILSPTMRAGKSQLLELIGLLTPRPWHIIQPSPAVLFRKLSAEHPTLLQDEAETVFTAHGEQAEPVRAVFNAGHRRGVVVPRCVGEGSKQQLVNFEVFGPKALAAIGTLPATILDRSIVIRMRRATPAEERRVQKLRHKRAAAEATPIYAALAAWAEKAIPRFQQADPPAVPDELDGRAADCWEPLLAVGADASDGFYALLWQAALVLSGADARKEDATGLRLLRDIHQVAEAQGTDRIGSAELVEALCLDDSAPWGDWKHGKRITPNALARLLRAFDIYPLTVREGTVTFRGYHWMDFEDAWSRYPAPEPSSSDLQPKQVTQSSQDVAFSRFPQPQQTGDVSLWKNGANPPEDSIVSLVSVVNPPERGEEDAEATSRGADNPVPTRLPDVGSLQIEGGGGPGPSEPVPEGIHGVGLGSRDAGQQDSTDGTFGKLHSNPPYAREIPILPSVPSAGRAGGDAKGGDDDASGGCQDDPGEASSAPPSEAEEEVTVPEGIHGVPREVWAGLPPLMQTAADLFGATIVAVDGAPVRESARAPEPLSDGEPLCTPEDLARGAGRGQLVLRVGEARAWPPYPYAPGRAIASGRTAWIVFVRHAPDREFDVAVQAMITDPALNGPGDA